jgi:uncharacterized Zn-finger protein
VWEKTGGVSAVIYYPHTPPPHVFCLPLMSAVAAPKRSLRRGTKRPVEDVVDTGGGSAPGSDAGGGVVLGAGAEAGTGAGVGVVPRPCVCEVCGMGFWFPSKLKTHQLVHTRDRRFSCEICNASFTYATSLRVHRRLHTGEMPFSCAMCSARFRQTSGLTVHMRNHTKETYVGCPYCQKLLKGPTRLRAHILRHEDPTLSHGCPTCGKVLGSNQALKDHSRIHTGEVPFECEICGKKFRFRARLGRHREREHLCVKKAGV